MPTRPGPCHPSTSLIALPVAGLIREVFRDLVEEGFLRVRVNGLPVVSGVDPPVAECLAWQWDHSCQIHKAFRVELLANQGCRKASQRVAHHDGVLSIAHRCSHCLAVIPKPCSLVLDGQVNRDDAVPGCLKQWPDQMPVPCRGTATVDQYENGHIPTPLSKDITRELLPADRASAS